MTSTGGSGKGPEQRIVQACPEGGWEVVMPGAERASVHTETRQQAIDRARQILRNLGGGELLIRGEDGRFQDSDTVPPGNDPNPPRDLK